MVYSCDPPFGLDAGTVLALAGAGFAFSAAGGADLDATTTLSFAAAGAGISAEATAGRALYRPSIKPSSSFTKLTSTNCSGFAACALGSLAPNSPSII